MKYTQSQNLFELAAQCNSLNNIFLKLCLNKEKKVTLLSIFCLCVCVCVCKEYWLESMLNNEKVLRKERKNYFLRILDLQNILEDFFSFFWSSEFKFT